MATRKKSSIKKTISIEDISVGNVICFYDSGFRFAVVTKISSRYTRISKTNKLKVYMLHTELYNKVPITDVMDVYEYCNGKTVRKIITADLFE